MTGRIITAPAREDIRGPLIFLAGPIPGATDWQREAIYLIHERDPALHIANPRRDMPDTSRDFDDGLYDEQIEWECTYFERAARDGCILFWLPAEAAHHCNRAYAQTARFEIGEWKARHTHDGAHLAIGISDSFTGGRYLRNRFEHDCPDIPIRSSLQETCYDAVSLAQRRIPNRGASVAPYER